MTTSPASYAYQIPSKIEDMRQFVKLMGDLRTKNRFLLAPDTEDFVVNLIAYAKLAKSVQIEPQTKFWRARLHDLNAKDPLPLEQLGAPPPHLAGHGRLNPRGIPYLYLALDEITAISELRPWKNVELTVGEFHTTRVVKLANFSTQACYHQSIPDGMELTEIIWRGLVTWLFSAPFDPRDDTAYVPTQYLAERVKASEFDGLIYDSALHEGGCNVTLFDPALAIAVHRKKAKVNSISVDASFSDLAAG
jgi:RES domain-containing protein